jgi:hypothetical protein
MANSVPFRTSHELGPQLSDVFTGLPYWDQTGVQSAAGVILSGVTSPSYKLGNLEIGNDGAEYLWVQASANIAATATTGTELAITLPAFTAATGTQGWFTKPATAITSGQYFHARKGAYGSVTEPVT